MGKERRGWPCEDVFCLLVYIAMVFEAFREGEREKSFYGKTFYSGFELSRLNFGMMCNK